MTDFAVIKIGGAEPVVDIKRVLVPVPGPPGPQGGGIDYSDPLILVTAGGGGFIEVIPRKPGDSIRFIYNGSDPTVEVKFVTTNLENNQTFHLQAATLNDGFTPNTFIIAPLDDATTPSFRFPAGASGVFRVLDKDAPSFELISFSTGETYISQGSFEPISDNGTVTGTHVFDYFDGNAQSLTFTSVDCDLSWDNLPPNGNLGSVWFETTTGATLPSTLGGTSSPDWQVELLSLLTINSTQTFEIWVSDGSTIRINEFTYSGQ